ncbi:MAG: hypothetical protein ACYDAK_07940 [Candidatus Limnocylindrales bacterium]
MAEPAFEAFRYPGDEQPSGEIQLTVSTETRALIDRLSSQLRAFIPVGYHGDCVRETIEWCRQLRKHVRVQRVGGNGIDDPQFGSDYLRVPPSGYREADGEVHRHWWLLLEEHEHVFDPTVHRQFDDKGGFAPDRYVLDGVARLRRPGQR